MTSLADNLRESLLMADVLLWKKYVEGMMPLFGH